MRPAPPEEFDLFDRVVDLNPHVNGYSLSTAVMSKAVNEDGEPIYRYILERVWDDKLPQMLWVMLNPSTANALKDDPTIRRCVSFSKTYGMGSIRVINLYAYRTKSPAELSMAHRAGVDIIGPQNDELLVGDLAGMNAKMGLTIVAWGATKAPLIDLRVKWLREHYFGAWCLGKNADGSPKHPLYLADATALDAW